MRGRLGRFVALGVVAMLGSSLPVSTASTASTTTPTVTARSTDAATAGIGVPAYFYPGPLWEQLADAPGRRMAVMNPATGPGERVNDDYVDQVDRARAAGVTVIGYVHTEFGDRPRAEVAEEVLRYYEFYDVDGIFFDQASASCDRLPYYRHLASLMRSAATGDEDATVVVNPGTTPRECVMDVADIVMNFDGYYSTFVERWGPADWVWRYPAERFWHAIHHTPPERIDDAVERSREQHGGWVYPTPDGEPNAWDSLPQGDDWERLLDALGTPLPAGYAIVDGSGGVHAFDRRSWGDVPSVGVDTRAVDAAPTPGGGGYRVLDERGGVFSFGDARFHGSLPGLVRDGLLASQVRARGLAAVPDGDGYWILDEHGGVFSFGDARFHGSLPHLAARGHMPAGVTAATIAPTPSGDGYWILDEHGGIHTFGDADYHGSVPELAARGLVSEGARAVSMAVTPSGDGYWILDEHGGVFSFGDARFHGSLPHLAARGHMPAGVTAATITPTPSGDGYWILDRHGGIHTFGDAGYHGSLSESEVGARAIALLAS